MTNIKKMTIKEDDNKDNDDKEDHIEEDDWRRKGKVSTCLIAVVLGFKEQIKPTKI